MNKKLLSVLLVCILFLSACGAQTEYPAPKPTLPPFDISTVTFSNTQVMLSEGHDSVGAPYGLKKTLEICEHEGVTYAFEPQISYEERAACIWVTNALLDRIGAGKNIQINIYAADTYDRTFTENSSIYTHLQNWKSPEYTASLLYGLLGDYCHYGTLYGYANYLGSELFGTAVPVCDENPKLEGNCSFLDLNLLCFRPEFVSADDIEIAKKISNAFVNEYINAHGEAEFLQLMKKSGTVE